MSEHSDRWDDDVAAYALDALGGEELRAFQDHLEGCSLCAERLRWLTPAVDVLPATVPHMTPPPNLKARLMDVVEREAALVASSEGAERTDAPAPGSDPDAPGRTARIFGVSLRPALAGLAVTLLLAAGVTGYLVNGSSTDDGGATTTYQAGAAAHPSSNATGELIVDGDAGMLHVSNLPATRRGEVYQAWIQDSASAGGSVHPSSVFVVAEGGVGDVAIPHGLADARRVMVTREPKGGSELPSENPVLIAEMN